MLLSIFSTLAQPEFTDPENLTDTNTASLGINRTTDDSENISDTFLVTREQSSTDNLGSTDNFSTVQNFVQSYTDNTPATDTTSYEVGNVLQDSAGSTDSSQYDLGLEIQDAEAVTDTVLASFMYFQNPDDLLNTTDSMVSDLALARILDETTPIQDTIALDISVDITDGVGSTDTIAYGFDIQVFDGTALTDTSTPLLTYERIFTDSESSLDTISLDRSVVFSEGDEPFNVITFGSAPGFGIFVFGRGQSLISDTTVPSKEYFFTDNTVPRDNFKTVKAVLRLKITVEEAEVRWDLG